MSSPKATKAELDVIIINWNGGDLIKACLDSLQQAKKITDNFSVVIVDNSSTDGSAEDISGLSNVAFVQNRRNEGFGRACNQGAKLGHADLIVFLNPDTQVSEGVFSAVADFMRQEQNAHISVCGIKLIDDRGETARSCARFPTLGRFLLNSLGLDRLAALRSQAVIMADWNHLDTRLVDHVIGACYVIRREMFERLGGFDEDFFVYYEDLDLSRRVSERGGKILYLSEISAKHVGGGTTEQAKALRTFLSTRSRLLYAQKHFNTISFLCFVPVIAICEPIIRILVAGAGRKLNFREERKAAILFWKWLVFHRRDPRWMP